MPALPCGTADLRRRNADLLCDIGDLLCDKSDLPRGNADLPGGKLDLPRGRANLLCGNAELSCGKSNLPRGKAGLPRGNVNLLCGNVDLLCGKADLPCVESSRTESGALMRALTEWKRISDPLHELALELVQASGRSPPARACRFQGSRGLPRLDVTPSANQVAVGKAPGYYTPALLRDPSIATTGLPL